MNHEFQQDTLVKPQIQNQSLPSITVQKLQIDLERAEEIMKRFEQREKEIADAQQQTVLKPKLEVFVRKPSIEVDELLAKYGHIGCTPRANFPDTFSLTVLERYYQPMTSISPSESLPTTVSATVIEKNEFANESKLIGYPSSITVFLMFGLILLAFIKYHFGRNMLGTFRSFFSYRHSVRMFEERRESDRQAAYFSNIFFILIAGIFISLVLPFFGASPLWGSYTLSVLFFSAATGLLYFLKAGIWRALGVIFLVQSFTKTYIYNMYLYNRNIGLFIFPLVVLIPYMNGVVTPYIVYSIIAIIVLSYILKFWRIFEIFHVQNVRLFYFILYLCTLEILPLLLFIKGCKVLCEFTLFL